MSLQLYLTGKGGIVTMQADDITSSSADANFGVANLKTGNQWQPFRFGTPAALDQVTFDLNQIQNGTFENGTPAEAPPEWEVLAGTPVISTTQAADGTQSVELNADGEGIFQDFEAAIGKVLNVAGSLYGDGTNTISLYLQDLRSGKWMTGAGAWQTTKVAFATRTTASFAETTATPTVEDSGYGHTVLRYTVDKTGSGTAFADKLLVYPRLNFCSVHAHTIDQSQVPSIRRSTDNFAGNDVEVATMTVRRGRFYKAFTNSDFRWWRVRLPRANSRAPFIGQIAFGHTNTLLAETGFDITSPVRMRQPQIRVAGPSGLVSAASRTNHQSKSIDLGFTSDRADLLEVVEKIGMASKWGGEPVVLVPEDDQDDVWLMNSASEIVVGRLSDDAFGYRLALEEQMFFGETK